MILDISTETHWVKITVNGTIIISDRSFSAPRGPGDAEIAVEYTVHVALTAEHQTDDEDLRPTQVRLELTEGSAALNEAMIRKLKDEIVSELRHKLTHHGSAAALALEAYLCPAPVQNGQKASEALDELDDAGPREEADERNDDTAEAMEASEAAAMEASEAARAAEEWAAAEAAAAAEASAEASAEQPGDDIDPDYEAALADTSCSPS